MSDEKNNDKRIRESYFKKDKDFNEAIKQEMEEEENMLKGYFKEYKKPVQEDPSIMSTPPPMQRGRPERTGPSSPRSCSPLFEFSVPSTTSTGPRNVLPHRKTTC